MSIETFIQTSVYFLALINPASKVLLLSSAQPRYTGKKLASISFKATLAALVILLVLSAVGHFILSTVFRVEIYSLEIAGGIVLFIVGLNAVQKGRFFEQEYGRSPEDISIVPLAAPMIAGPGTITAAISFPSTLGIGITTISLVSALAVNFLLMLSSLWIGRAFDRFNAFGPLIRIAGLVVAAVAVQMVLSGLAEWYAQR